MQQIFVELYNYTHAWRQETRDAREAFVAQIFGALEQLAGHGVEVLAYAVNDPATDRRAPYDFFCVYRVPDAAFQRVFESQIAASGWYRYFEQVNLSGAALTPPAVLLANIELAAPGPQGEPVSDKAPPEKRYAVIQGCRMAYVEAGTGRPIVFVHGDIMSSYLWRNVVPHVRDLGRCVAVDLIGAGDSDKLAGSAPGSYGLEEHCRYFDAFMEELDLGGDIVLVGHDWGSNIAFEWAMRNPSRVRGISFCEAILPPFEWTDWPVFAQPLFRRIRAEDGERAVLEDNFFVNAVQLGILRKLSAVELAEIVRPYAAPGEARRPTYTWPRSVPFEPDRTPTRAAVERQAQWLSQSPLPKLHLRGVPGAVTIGRRAAAIGAWPNVREVPVRGFHWPPEDDPHSIGRALADWIARLPR